jgi:uncharacterized protein (DUF58 family)
MSMMWLRRLRDRARRGRQRLRQADGELRVACAWLVLAGLGWLVGSRALAIIGVLGAVTTAALYIWQRDCLTGVTYRCELGQTHATFGERVALQVEIVNDKLLPLSWLRVGARVPASLAIEDTTVVPLYRNVAELVHIQPMLPYQRIRRRLTVECDRRGEHHFGPAKLSSGDPLGLRRREQDQPAVRQLVVYPKVFALAPAGIVSRALVGPARSRMQFLPDPSRVAGVREYRPGDPLRHVDWRATARSSALLVREFEPTVTLHVAVFLDFHVSGAAGSWSDPPEREFAIAVAASLISELVTRKITTGLYTSGAIAGQPVGHTPSSSPGALAEMMGSLARATPGGSIGFAPVVIRESGRLAQGASVVVVASDFPAATMVAIAELRRRHAVTALWVKTDRGEPPRADHIDGQLRADYCDDWQRRELLELAE